MDRSLVKNFLAAPRVASTMSEGFHALLNVPDLCDLIYEDIHTCLIAGNIRGACSYVLDLSSKDASSLKEWVLGVYAEMFVDFDQLVLDDAFNLVSARLCDYSFPVLPMVPKGLNKLVLQRSSILSLDTLPPGIKKMRIIECDELKDIEFSGLPHLSYLEVGLSNTRSVNVPFGVSDLVLYGLMCLESVVVNNKIFDSFQVEGCESLDWSCLNGVYINGGKVVVPDQPALFFTSPGFLFFIDPLEFD